MIPFFSLTVEEKINVYRNRGAGYETLISVCFYAIILSGITYIFASMLLLEKYRKSIKDKFSNIEKINLAWLRYLVFGIAVIWLVVIFGDDAFIFGTTAIFIFYLGYYGIRQAGVFIPKSQVDILPGELDNLPKLKYERSGLNKDQSGDIYDRLIELMNREKLFSDPDLSLATLAKMLDVHPNHLSQVINSHENKSFYDFINFYRVEEFKKLALLPVNRNFTLLSLAFECGFNSKTSFNRNFKKLTGQSPSEYLQQLDLAFT
jgi:AraC-like DNA-binding protein